MVFRFHFWQFIFKRVQLLNKALNRYKLFIDACIGVYFIFF